MSKIATEVYSIEDVKLGDDTSVGLRPLNIKNLRVFMREWTNFITLLSDNAKKKETDKTKLDENGVNDAQFDVFIRLSELCLEKPLKVAGKEFDKPGEYSEYLEDVLDQELIYRVLDKCGGLKLNDPNLQAAAMMAAAGND